MLRICFYPQISVRTTILELSYRCVGIDKGWDRAMFIDDPVLILSSGDKMNTGKKN